MKTKPTYEELVEWLGEKRYHAYMGDSISSLRLSAINTPIEDLIKLIYGKVPSIEEVNEVVNKIGDRREWK